MTDEYLAQEQLMNQALDKLPNYKTDDLLYRIENLSDEEIKNYYKVGEEVTNKHFTSSTYDIDAIAEAMRERNYTLMVHIIGKDRVTKIYSELEPCNFKNHKCKQMLDDLFPNGKKNSVTIILVF